MVYLRNVSGYFLQISIIMNLFGAPNSCPLADHLTLKSCNENDTEHCEDIQYLLFGLTIDCYITPIFYVLTVIFIVIGTLLNPLSIYCFFKMYKRDSQNIFLYVLSISDTINLHINFALPMIRHWELFDDYFRNWEPICRLVGVLTEFFLIFPAWLLVLLTIDRLIYILRLFTRRLSYTRRRAKISLLILAIFVLCLSMYRFYDVKGIDQSSVFAIITCNSTHHSILLMRNINLLIWTIFPLCCTLILSLIMIYEINTAKEKYETNSGQQRTLKWDRATKTTLLISILFPTLFHTPTGIMIALDLFYGQYDHTTIIVIILVARKLTMLLYEISLSCKFFVYIKTFPHFKEILGKLFQCDKYYRHRRGSSVELSHPVLQNFYEKSNSNKIRFENNKQCLSFSESRTTSFSRSTEKHSNTLHSSHQTEGSPKTFPEHQSMVVSLNESDENSYML
ncbi:hypothetical protein I4U23_026134 [Adineta vaga]|nr:hypothetical protein I4U23_026134 [Adineta vaga]